MYADLELTKYLSIRVTTLLIDPAMMAWEVFCTASLSEVCHSVLSMKLKMVSLNHLDDLVFQQLEVDLQAWIGQMGSGLLDGASIIMWNGMPPSLTFFLLPQWTRFSGSFC